MRNIALRLAYDGTRYHGWQVQKNAITVAETLEKALSKICGHPVRAVGCGRTDAGVHALRYCASFRTGCRIPADRIPPALNALLPRDIAAVYAVEAGESFNAIRACEKKEYIYRLHNSRIRDPFLTGRACFFPSLLDLDRMKAAAGHFVGTHDFKAVRSAGTETKTTVRTVFWCDIGAEGDMITLRVCADGFLYNMVRAIMGTVVYAGLGKLEPSAIPGLLEDGDRRLTGPTMPPQGLFMSRIWYPGAVGEMMRK
ncbi:MAG: tRNA pseudouridine(38-40) synthase TruA [Oscillospiraceae bacterium]|jgi:tRNA pseudouridine38-40 synthase|nr:tRNA pseudouridine(38-40) synthase TruA [Oscillospiraceae bacterium]